MSRILSRRDFAYRVGTAAFSLVASHRSFSQQTQEQRIRINADVGIGTIRPELHGHFAEHLGSCTYGGLWVGKDSRIPNIDGYRKQAVEYLRELGIPVLRWPGGCFADDYHWRDGIGPREKRPRTVNIHWGNYTEDNSFGTHEFVGLCRLIGAEPYFAGNVGSGTPEELRDWVEYCNFPSGSALSDERVRNGSREPFRISYWGIGNENWGCGGNMTPEEYAAQYRRFAGYVRGFGNTRPFPIACGPNGNDTDWSRRFLDAMKGRRYPSGFAMHFYSGGKNVSTSFTIEAMQEQLSSFAKVEQAIKQQRALMDGYDPERRMGLLVDEWGVWDRMVPEEEKRYGRLWQQITVRSAVAAALGLNVFHRQADKLIMCNIAQIVNVLHSMLLTYEDQCIRTPAYYAFELLKAHRAKIAVHVENDDTTPLGLSASASVKEKELVLSLVNPKHDTGTKVSCSLTGAAALSGKARILNDTDFNACNTFEYPDRIVPKDHAVEVEASRIRVELPPMSIVTVLATLA
ncbi:MAG TPA: alpha-L-arabinofuranosidase C-terminal domain-containing protein [Acidobacteriota bacterium]|nr:alpha-L-arabinofuranosidase C-terminal domain-containing protein [Acidobacteriota bacterium]